MSVTEESVCLHVVVAVYFVFFFWTIKGDLGRRIYRARMRTVWRWFLMPTKHSRIEQEWVRYQRVFAWLSLPFVVFVYVMFVVALGGG